MSRPKCTRCHNRPRTGPLDPKDHDLATAATKLHDQMQHTADLPHSAVAILKDWETTFAREVRRGHYCRPCLVVWTAALPTHPYR